jgi:hypothetical protein
MNTINSTEAFKQYQPLIESFTWKATKRYRYLEHDDIKQRAYLIFCEAIERYDENRKVKFITFLYHRLRTLNDYCLYSTYKEVNPIHKNQIYPDGIKGKLKDKNGKIIKGQMGNWRRQAIQLYKTDFWIDSYDYNRKDIEDVTYEQFEAAMDRLEESLDLSEDAQDIIDYLISREWETPGINRVPRLYSIKKYYRYWKGWMPKRTEQAWEEIKDWWKSGNHFLQEA